jgi:Uma2 family endonuclease
MWGALPPHGTILTTAEYLQTAESLRVQELIYGTLHVADSPHFRHQNLLLELAVLLRVFVGQHKLGTVCIAPQDVILDAARALILQPDLMFISNHRREIISDHIWGAPDMVLEVMSPHPRIGELEERLRNFGHYGVKECWLIHQLRREIEVIDFTANWRRRTFRGIDAIGSEVLPGFRISPELLSCW